jgi:two-component system, LytTR family, sensor kinase
MPDLIERVPLFKNRLLMHVLFWVGYLCYNLLIWRENVMEFSWEDVMIELSLLPAKMLAVYITLYGLIPHYLLQKHYIKFGAGLLLVMLACGLLQRGILIIYIYPNFFPDTSREFWVFYKLAHQIVIINSLLVFAIAVKVMKHWYTQQQKNQELEKEKMFSELRYLKSQVHPHFFFNILNNLYGLTLSKSDTAPEVVLRLSDLMSYMLYDTNTQWVPLEKEINYIRNYIALEKLRFGKRFNVSFQVQGDTSSMMIAPLLLLPFIENSFKHSINKEIEGAWIAIDLTIKGTSLAFTVENSMIKEPMNGEERESAGGLGLQNVKRRLELLYKEHHTLKIFEEESEYLVVLKLDLHETQKQAVLWKSGA